MGNKMQLTSVKVPEDLFEQFKIACVKYKFSVQKLTERSMYLYLTNEELNSITDAIRFARAQLVVRNKSVLTIGSKVTFTSSTRGTMVGSVKKINRKFILVDTQAPGSFTSGVWKVPASMLTLV